MSNPCCPRIDVAVQDQHAPNPACSGRLSGIPVTDPSPLSRSQGNTAAMSGAGFAMIEGTRRHRPLPFTVAALSSIVAAPSTRNFASICSPFAEAPSSATPPLFSSATSSVPGKTTACEFRCGGFGGGRVAFTSAGSWFASSTFSVATAPSSAPLLAVSFPSPLPRVVPFTARPSTSSLSIAIAAKFKSTLSTESLLTSEEAVIAAAAYEAVALAKAAVKVAKDAALLVKKKPSAEPAFRSHVSSKSDNLLLKWVQRMETGDDIARRPIDSGAQTVEDVNIVDSDEESDNVEPTYEELELLQEQLSDSIAVRSRRQIERKARRERVAEKTATNIVSFKSGSPSRRKRVPVQEVDYSDPLRYLRTTTSTTRLLTSTEEVQLSEGIQDLLKLEKLREEVAERCGGQPTFAQWAAVAGVDQKTLRKRLNHGKFCKDKMIKSNIRLVISIAKNYQGAGMNLEDLVQEGCRGLVRGAEKFDASKGFKFSTYAHWWIKQAVRKSLSDQSRTIRLPFHMVEATYRVKEARKQFFSENGRNPNDEEVAAATGLSMKRLGAVLLTPKAPRSLEQKIGINQNLKPSEVIAHPDAETAEEQLIKQMMKKDLEMVLESLNPREQQVIRWRFGMDDGRMKTLQEIGEMMGVSRERVRQIESVAFRKLRNKKRTKHFQQYLVSS
ncbi:RNA polymerase sigma factor sigB [Arachis hypogaea]|uniref:RNA polymerase sigma factor sigB n=1 Tax=Arachis hypogaea TaxID=3818 RepID=UPI000DEC8B74|nr:RNA polymerase sigma factor sigB [Arachis hypogaea]